MPCCSAYGCSNKSDKTGKSVTYHKFPKNEDLRAKWVHSLRRENFTPSSHSVVCSEHFVENNMDRTSLCCVRLRYGAIPSVFPKFPEYLQDKETTRKPPTASISSDTEGEPSLEQPTTSNSNSPTEAALKRKLEDTELKLKSSRKKIKALLLSKRRLQKKNAELTSALSDLKKSELLSSNSLESLETSSQGVKDLHKGQIQKSSNQTLPPVHSPGL